MPSLTSTPTARRALRQRLVVVGVLLRGYGSLPALCFVGLAVLVQRIGPAHVPLPTNVGVTDPRTSVTTFTSLLFAIGIAQLSAEPAEMLAASAPRRWATTRFLRVCVPAAAVVLLASAIAPAGMHAKVVSSTLLFVAESFVGARVIGVRMLWALPLAHLLAAITFGSAGPDSGQPWAWFLGARTSPVEVVVPAVAAALAILVWARMTVREDLADVDVSA